MRTRVHEYGGGAWLLHADTAFLTNFADQRLYRLHPGAKPQPITAEPPEPGALRYADGRATPDGRAIVCVRETHDGQVLNELVSVPTTAPASRRCSPPGATSTPTRGRAPTAAGSASPAGTIPTCPGTAASCGSRRSSARRRRRVAGGPDESIWQPEWSPGGRAPLRHRPQRLVEPLPRRRAADQRGGRARLSAVALRRLHLRLPRRRRDRRAFAATVASSASAAAAPGAERLEGPRAPPYTAYGYPGPRRRATASCSSRRAPARSRRSSRGTSSGAWTSSRERAGVRRSCRVRLRAAANRVRDRGRAHRPRLLLPAPPTRASRARRTSARR